MSEIDRKEFVCSACQMQTKLETCDAGFVVVRPAEGIYGEQMGRCPQAIASRRSQQVQQGLATGGLDDPRYQRGWDQMNLNHKSWIAAYEASQRLKHIVKHGVNIVLTGPTGRGKTHAAVLLMRDAMTMGYGGVRVVWSDFLDTLKSSYNKKEITEAELLEKLTSPDIVFIDDIGQGERNESGKTDFSASRLEKVISKRYDAGKPTIITANFALTSLGALFGERISSRIGGSVMQIVFNGPDMRKDEQSSEAKTFLSGFWGDIGKLTKAMQTHREDA